MSSNEQEALFNRVSERILEILDAPIVQFRLRVEKRFMEIDDEVKSEERETSTAGGLIASMMGNVWESLVISKKIFALREKLSQINDPRAREYGENELQKLNESKAANEEVAQNIYRSSLDSLRKSIADHPTGGEAKGDSD